MELRLERNSLKQLCLWNFTCAWSAFLLPGVWAFVCGPRMVSLTPGNGTTYVIEDKGSHIAAFATIAIPLYVGITMWTAGQRILRGRNCTESYWAALAMASVPLLAAGAVHLSVSIMVRALPVASVNEIPRIAASLPGRIVILGIANRMLVPVAAIVAAALLHRTAFSLNRYANPLR